MITTSALYWFAFGYENNVHYKPFRCLKVGTSITQRDKYSFHACLGIRTTLFVFRPKLFAWEAFDSLLKVNWASDTVLLVMSNTRKPHRMYTRALLISLMFTLCFVWLGGKNKPLKHSMLSIGLYHTSMYAPCGGSLATGLGSDWALKTRRVRDLFQLYELMSKIYS